MQQARFRFLTLGVLTVAWGGLVAGGCRSPSAHEVVVYTALDAEFSEPVLRRFSEETGITAVPKFDTEATKTVGLAQAILAERDRPRCDVFWNNEILNTLRLEREGLLESYRPAGAEAFPAQYRSPTGRGMGLRRGPGYWWSTRSSCRKTSGPARSTTWRIPSGGGRRR